VRADTRGVRRHSEGRGLRDGGAEGDRINRGCGGVESEQARAIRKQRNVRFGRTRIIAPIQQLQVTRIDGERFVVVASNKIGTADIVGPPGTAVRLPREWVRLGRSVRGPPPARPGGGE
jgi:hypothetical protein